MTSVNPETITEFIEEPSWTMRAKLIERIAALYIDEAFDPDEVRTALEIFRVTLYDGEPLVRRILAETLKQATGLPHDIVLAIARDEPEVAKPFLEVSPLLDADDLAIIARNGTDAHRSAIAGRTRDRGAAPELILETARR